MGSISMKKYQDGEIILRPGDHPRTLFKVLAGGITMYTHYGQPSQHLVGSYSPPFCFGETSVLADHPCPYTIIAKGRVVLMLIPEESFAEDLVGRFRTKSPRDVSCRGGCLLSSIQTRESLSRVSERPFQLRALPSHGRNGEGGCRLLECLDGHGIHGD